MEGYHCLQLMGEPRFLCFQDSATWLHSSNCLKLGIDSVNPRAIAPTCSTLISKGFSPFISQSTQGQTINFRKLLVLKPVAVKNMPTALKWQGLASSLTIEHTNHQMLRRRKPHLPKILFIYMSHLKAKELKFLSSTCIHSSSPFCFWSHLS